MTKYRYNSNNGKNIASGYTSNYSSCCAWCQTLESCLAITYGLSTAGGNASSCYLKNTVPAPTVNSVFVSAHY